MHLLVLGATGRTGQYVYKYALEQGHRVTVLVRQVSTVAPLPNLTIVQGSVLSGEDIDHAFAAAAVPIDAVIQCLNARRASEFPWAKFIGPPRLLADSTANAVRALHKQQQTPPVSGNLRPRLVVMSANGVGESIAQTPLFVKFLINCSNVGKSYKDHEATDKELEADCGTDIVWTVAYPVALGDSGTKPVKTFRPTELGASLFVSRESFAKWMVDVAAGKYGTTFDNKRVVASN
ncbi:NAD(P)-binding protein [Thozetella sp. PMI_491]|nr:NAD(P)-binding protein [Thozetella sp. PMI_491]